MQHKHLFICEVVIAHLAVVVFPRSRKMQHKRIVREEVKVASLAYIVNSVVQHLLLMQRKHCEVGARFHDSEECRCWKVTI